MEIAMVILSIIGAFIPNLVEDLENKYLRDKKNISSGNIYAMIDEALTQISVKGQATAQKFLNKLSTALMTLNTAGSQAYADYINRAKRRNLEKQQKITAKSVEASINEQAANTLANAYEGLSPRNKDSKSGQALRKGIKTNLTKAAEAYKEIDPTIDTSRIDDTIRKYDAVETPVNMDTIKNQNVQERMGHKSYA